MLDEQKFSLIINEMAVSYQPDRTFIDIRKPAIELPSDAKNSVNELLDKLSSIYNRTIFKNTYLEQLPSEIKHSILHEGFNDITNTIKDKGYVFFRQALHQQDSSFAQLLLTNLLYHPQEIENLFTEIFGITSSYASYFFEKMIASLSNNPELRYQILSRVMDMNFMTMWSRNVIRTITRTENNTPFSQNDSLLVSKLLSDGFLSNEDLVHCDEIIYKTNYVDPSIQAFFNAILDDEDLLKLFFSKPCGKDFLFDVIRQKDKEILFQIVNRLVNYPEEMKTLVAVKYNGCYIIQTIIDYLTDHKELKDKIILQVIDEPFIPWWILETDHSTMQNFIRYIAKDAILFKRFLLNREGKPLNNLGSLLLQGKYEQKDILLSVLSNDQELLRELLLTPHDHVSYSDKDYSKGQVDNTTNAEVLMIISGANVLVPILVSLVNSNNQQLLHEVLLIRCEDGLTIFSSLLLNEVQISDSLELILDFLNTELLLKQLIVHDRNGLGAMQAALINEDKQIIDLLCKKLSKDQYLLGKFIEHLNSNSQNLSAVDKQLWLENINSLYNIIHKNSEKLTYKLIVDVFLVKDDLQETLFSKLSKQQINLKTVEQVLEKNNSVALAVEKLNKELILLLLSDYAKFKQWIDDQWAQDSSKLQKQILTGDNQGNTFLHYLTYLNHSEKLQYLLTVSSQSEAFLEKLLKAINHEGQRALDWATRTDYMASQQILEQWVGVGTGTPVAALTEQMTSINLPQQSVSYTSQAPNSIDTEQHLNLTDQTSIKLD